MCGEWILILSFSLSKRGIPVATVAINNGMNAGLLAIRILSAGNFKITEAMGRYLRVLKKQVIGKVEKLDEVGWEAYEVERS